MNTDEYRWFLAGALSLLICINLYLSV